MAGEREHILDVLEALESRLTSSGRPQEAGRIGLIRRNVSSDRPLDAVLETLYGVQGYHELALRLMWYADKVRDPFASAPLSHVVSRRAEELLSVLPPESPPPSDAASGKVQTIPEAVDRFGATVEAAKHAVVHEGQLSELTPEWSERLGSSVQSLGHAAGLEENRDVVRFADAVVRFLELVREQGLTRDIRVVNLLDSANLTLQTAVQTHAPEDYDSLQEITRLLENPLPLFEQPPPSPDQA